VITMRLRRNHFVMRRSCIKKQNGAALLIMLTILILGAASLLLGKLNKLNFQFEHYHESDQSLLTAKEALIGWALSYSQRPGLLPVPDRRNDNLYDGESDCPNGAINTSHLLGQLPWKAYLSTASCSSSRGGLGAQLKDADGERLWYAVSANLLYSSGYPTINSDTANLAAGWITVRDTQGNILSNRVAAVLLAPGKLLAGQNRSAAAPTAANYLDSLTIGTTSYRNFDSDLDFIAGNESDSFNDRLTYITIDELIAQVERKVGNTVRRCLDAYALASGGKYPWAAPLEGSASPSYTGVYNAHFGRIPTTLSTESSPGINDLVMSTSWPSSCFSVPGYWASWQASIFYHVAPGYAPGSGSSCPTCLTLNSGGSYRAMVVMGRSALAGQSRANNADKGTVTNYLEADNADIDIDYENQSATAAFNDRVICIDGSVLCK